MSSHVDPEEVRAILGSDSASRPAEVVPRDFEKPLRLSVLQRRELERVLEARLPELARELGEPFGPQTLELVSLGEADAGAIFGDEEPEPLAVLRFVTGGQLAWLVWENPAAVAAAERMLGATTATGEGRVLSSIEVSVLADALAPLVGGLCATFGLPMADPVLVQRASEVGDWRRGDADDPHRLELELSLTGSGGSSTLRAFLPGFLGATGTRPDEKPPADVELPPHVTHVTVELLAHLEGCEVSLAELLALEPGDVVPIEARVGDLVDVTVGDQPYGKAVLGRRGKRLAIRMHSIENQVKP